MAVCVIMLRRKKPEAERAFKIPCGYTIPIVTIIVFGGLLIGIFTDVSRDYAGNVLFNNYWVAVVMGVFFLCTAAYALFVMPIFKKKAEARASARVKRRPGR